MSTYSVSGTLSSSKEVTANTANLVPALNVLSVSLLKLLCFKPPYSQLIKRQLGDKGIDVFSYLKGLVPLINLHRGGCQCTKGWGYKDGNNVLKEFSANGFLKVCRAGKEGPTFYCKGCLFVLSLKKQNIRKKLYMRTYPSLPRFLPRNHLQIPRWNSCSPFVGSPDEFYYIGYSYSSSLGYIPFGDQVLPGAL